MLRTDHTVYAHWNANTYNITYNSNKPSGASGNVTGSTANSSHTYDTAKALTANGFSLTGWRFNGWNTKADGTGTNYSNGQSVKNLTATHNGTVTLYAKWVANTYTVTYNSNKPSGATGNVTGSTGSSSHTYDTAKALTSNGFSLTGWRFNEWNTKADGTGTNYSNGQSVKNLTSANGGTVTLYAKWVANTYTVTYNANKPGGASSNVTGSTANSSHTYDTAKALTSNGFSLTGWRFNGWNTAANGSGTSYGNAASVKNLTATHNGTVTLYAQWVANTYTVAYNANKPSNATSNVAGTTAGSSHTYDTAKALTANGYSLVGWTFKGWNTAANGTGASYANGASVKNLTATHGATVTLYAQWTANTYYVSYSANFIQSTYPNSRLLYSGAPSTNTMPLTTHTYDTARELSANLYGITGYDFDGWSQNQNGSGASYADRASIKNLTSANGATVVLYAKWHIHTYSIDVNTLGGRMPAATPTSYTINSSTVSIGNPTRTGYDFYGWSVTGAGEHGRTPILNTDPAQIPTGTYGNLHFTASWGEIEYRVQYNFNGGTGNAIGAQTATYGRPFTVATGTGVVSRDGYAFSGYWNTFADGSGNSYREGTSAQNLTTLSGDTVVLYAVWNANMYALTLDAAGGTLPDAANWTPNADRSKSTKQIAFDSAIGTLLVPTRAGYEFAGWYNDLGEGVMSTTVYSQAAPMTLYARWTPHVYDVYFYKGAVGATGSMEPLQFTYGTEKPLTPNGFGYTGHTFLGWALKQGATEPTYADGTSVSNLTTDQNGVVFLYAVWSENHYAINYHSNGVEVADGFPDPYREEDVAYTKRFWPPDAADLGFSLTGYTFAGWSDTADADTGNLYPPTDEVQSLTDQDGVTVNLWAIWTPTTYRLTLDATGGKFDATLFQGVGQIWSPETNYVAAYRQIKYDEQHLCTIEPAWTGYDFAGWYTAPQEDPYAASSGEGVPVSASDPFKNLGDTVIYAHWTPHTYTLNLVHYNSESMTDTILLGQTLRFNEPFTLPTAAYKFDDPNFPSYGHILKDYQKTGFAVSGWSITRDGETNYQLGQTVSGLDSVGDPDKPYTLYLTQAAGRYTVEFDPGAADDVAQDSLMLPQTWLYTDYVDVPWCTMVRQGYEFSHWTTNVDNRTYTPGYGQKFHQMVDIGETLTLTAHWTAKEITLRFMETDLADRTITYDSQITRVAKAVSDSKCTFEGWWTKKDGSLDRCFFDWNGNINQRIDTIFPYWHEAGNDKAVVELYPRWTFEVKYEFPYGGDDPTVKPSNFSAGQAYGDPSNANNFKPSYGLPTPNYDGRESNIDNDGNVRRFAGWYDAPVGGNLVTNDTLATGPTQPDPWSDFEDVVLYARWYVDVTLDFPEYAPYTDGWTFEYGRDLAHAENDRGQTVVSYVQGIPYRGDASFALGLPRAEREGYAYIGWNADGQRAIKQGEPANFDGEIQSGDTVDARSNYTIYLEYAKREVDVTVRYWQQVIEGEDADGRPTTGLIPSIYSDDTYTSNDHYKLVGSDTRTERLFAEEQLSDADYHEGADVDAADRRYRGFTYHATRIAKDMNREGAMDAEALIVWNGATTPEQAKADTYDGCVASDGTSVVDVFYTRNKYDITLHDFKVTDGAGLEQVRGSAHTRANSSNALAYSPAEAAELPGRATTIKAWFEEEITSVGRSWAGYDFSGWDIEPKDLGYSKDVANETPDVRLEGDVYTFAVTDSDLVITPKCTPRDDTEYHATLHYQSLINATSVEEDRSAWPTSLPIRLTGTTDALTGWILRADAVDADDANVIEGITVGTEDFNASGFPDDVTFDGANVFDPYGFTGASIVNPVVRADSNEALDVYYTRNAYLLDVLGYEATHKDGTPVGEEGRIEAYLWDNLKGGAANSLENTSADAGQNPNKISYSIYFASPVSVVAVPHEGTELLGYTSSDTDIWNTKTLSAYAADLGIELDANPLTDSAGLANTSPNNPYTFKYEGEDTAHPMPIVPDNDDGTEGVIELKIEGQPARTSYEVVVMLQDRGTETNPAYGAYTQHGQTKAFDTVAASDGSTRLLRYWADGTYVSANSDDIAYVPAVEGFGLSATYTPALFGYEAFDGRGIVDLTELTPEGNAGLHGTSIAPLNKAYIYMDRNARSLSYSYAVDGEYADAVTLNEDVMSTLPSSVGAYFGADVTVAKNPTANGWEFKGWTWVADPDTGREDFPYVGQGTDSESVTVPDFDVDIVGTWAPREYELAFDGGTAYDQSPATNLPDSMSIPFNSKWAVPDTVPTRDGYTFLGWTFADEEWDARLADQPTMTDSTLDSYKQELASEVYFGGVPLLMQPGETQKPWSFYQENERALHAVWMKNSYDLNLELGEGSWTTGIDVPLSKYMTGSEIPIPAPVYKGHTFIGWDAECTGSPAEGNPEEGTYPAISFGADDSGNIDRTKATVNKWAWGDITLTAKYDVLKYDVALNIQGGTLDGTYTGNPDADIAATYPEGNVPYASADLSIPYGTEITEDTSLPEPTRPGYNFTGWVDANGNPIGYGITYDDEGNPTKTDHPYTFEPNANTSWVATWTGAPFKIEYIWGNNAPENVNIDMDAFKSSRGYAPKTFKSDMVTTVETSSGTPVGTAVTAFDLPTITELNYTDDTFAFEGWYTTENFDFGTGISSFDPAGIAAELTEAGKDTYTLYAKFSKGTVGFTEKLWLEVLDTEGLGLDDEWVSDGAYGAETKEINGRTYIAQNGRAYVCDDALTLDRKGEVYQGVTALGVAPAGYVFDDDTDNYRIDYSFSAYLNRADGKYTVNGFYNLVRSYLKVTDNTSATVKSGDTPLWDTDEDGYLNADGNPWQEGDGDRFVPAPYGADATLECTPDEGYRFTSWVPDGTIPSGLDVFENPTSFKMPSYDVSVEPFVELISYKVYYRDDTGSVLADIAQTTYTIKDEFALANLDENVRPGYTFDKWVAAMADEDGNKLDIAINPVPQTVGYDTDNKYMWVRTGTIGDLVFSAAYTAKRYTVTILIPDEAKRDAQGYPIGLDRDPRLEWSVDPETGDVTFTYAPDTVGADDDPIEIDLKPLDAHPYKIDGWEGRPSEGNDEGDNPPTLNDGVIKIGSDTTGGLDAEPTGVTPKTFIVTVDPAPEDADVPEGYEVDTDKFKEDMDKLIDDIANSDVDPDKKPVIMPNEDGTWTVEFDVESEPQITLPKPELKLTDPDNPPANEFDFIGWADNEEGTNPTLEYLIPRSDLDNFEEGKPVTPVPVWLAKDTDKTSVIIYLPDSERRYHEFNEPGDAANEWTYAFAGTPLSETKSAYAENEAFNAKITPSDGYHLGYHIEWYGEFDDESNAPTGDRLSALPTNFPESGTIHIWGAWAQDDDIRPVGFNNVSFGTSGPPGWSGPNARSAYALDGGPDNGDMQGTGSMEGVRSGYAMARSAYAAVAYYYKSTIGLVVKDDANDTFVKVDYIDASVMSAVDQYLGAGWLFDGYYLEGDEAKDIIIASDGKVDQGLLQQKTSQEDIDLAFTDSWTRKQLVRIDLAGGTGDKSKVDATLYWWPDLDVFISPSNPAIAQDDRKSGITGTIERKSTLIELADQGLVTPAPRVGEDGAESQFLGYFGRDRLGIWPKDGEGDPVPAAAVERFGAIGVTETYLDTFKDVDGKDVSMPYGCDIDDPYDPKAPGYYGVRWEAKWQGDFDEVYFNATVPMSMSFMVKSDGTAVGPDPGAYQIRNYSNAPITVEDMSFEWADASELEALFGRGGADALALSAKPTDGQGYANSVTLSKADAVSDAMGLPLVSRYVFADADRWRIERSIGVDPDSLDPERDKDTIASLPALRLDYSLSSGGVKPLTVDGGKADTAHRIGTLKLTLKTVR